MFVIRQAKIDDLPMLLKLAKMVHFINLPPDRDIVTAKILRSRECFLKAAGAAPPEEHAHHPPPQNGQVTGLGDALKTGDFFMFVLEDSETGSCLGTSQVIARMGGPGNPNYSFKLEKRQFFSRTLQTGATHIVARLHADESGPTEIGGLILQPAARGQRLGRLLSFVRFHFIGLHRALFSDRVVAEMMAPITLDGQNMLWEYLGRRFIPLSYTEADLHCQRSREFIAALLPKEDIYLSLLPPEARDVVGRVNDETVPARKLLEKLGFASRDFVDPFDGGPHLEAATDQVTLVKATRPAVLAAPAAPESLHSRGIVSALGGDGEYRAAEAEFAEHGRERISLTRALMEAIGWEAGMTVGVTPLDDLHADKPGRRRPKGARADSGAGGGPRRPTGTRSPRKGRA